MKLFKALAKILVPISLLMAMIATPGLANERYSQLRAALSLYESHPWQTG
jgi:hypothetical protein